MPAELRIIHTQPYPNYVFFHIESVVRKKAKQFYTWYYKWSDGNWRMGKEDQTQFRREKDCFIEHASDSCTDAFRQETLNALDGCILPWFEDEINKKAIAQAVKTSLEDSIDSLKHEIVETENNLVKMKKSLADLETELASLSQSN